MMPTPLCQRRTAARKSSSIEAPARPSTGNDAASSPSFPRQRLRQRLDLGAAGARRHEKLHLTLRCARCALRLTDSTPYPRIDSTTGRQLDFATTPSFHRGHGGVVASRRCGRPLTRNAFWRRRHGQVQRRSSPRKRKAPIHMCCDRILTGTEKVRAMHAAILENSKNAPPVQRTKKLFGASSMAAPFKMALEAGKKWADGKTLNVSFLDGSATQKQRVIAGHEMDEVREHQYRTSPPGRPPRTSGSPLSPTMVRGPTSARTTWEFRRASRP